MTVNCKQNGCHTRSSVECQQHRGEYYPESFHPPQDIIILHLLTVVVGFKSTVQSIFLVRTMQTYRDTFVCILHKQSQSTAANSYVLIMYVHKLNVKLTIIILGYN